MKRYWAYLRYVMRHRRFVREGCRKFGVGRWQAWTHDLSKYSRAEFGAYARSFYNSDGSKRSIRDVTGAYDPTRVSDEFDRAWLHHIRHNPHHWQYWCIPRHGDEPKPVRIPRRYIYEMIADWYGANRANGGDGVVTGWWDANKDTMVLHPESREVLRRCITFGTYVVRTDNAR